MKEDTEDKSIEPRRMPLGGKTGTPYLSNVAEMQGFINKAKTDKMAKNLPIKGIKSNPT